MTAADLLEDISSAVLAASARDAGAAPAIDLPAELTIYHAAATGARFATRLAEGGALELDASAVTEVDAAGIQLLLAARRHAAAWDRAFSLRNATAELRSALALLGLSSLSSDVAPEAMP